MSISIDPREQTIVRNLNLDGNNHGCTLGKWPCLGKKFVSRHLRWSPPLAKILKINIDGSSRGNLGHASI